MVQKQKSNSSEVELFQIDQVSGNPVPLVDACVSAGFPAAIESFSEKSLDLHELLIKHPAATFFVRVKGDSMVGAGISAGDILIVDRALSVSHNKIVIARVADEFTVKRIALENDRIFLMPANESYDPIEITDQMDAEVWGIVTYIIHKA